MNEIKVLGIGSPFGDDQIGWIVVEKLKQRDLIKQAANKFLDIENHDRPGTRLLELIHGANTVFLIDAVVAGNTIGTVYRFQNAEIEEFKGPLSTHDIGLAQTLQLGKSLNLLPSNIIFYGIEIDSKNSNENISALVKAAIVPVIERIENEIITLGHNRLHI